MPTLLVSCARVQNFSRRRTESEALDGQRRPGGRLANASHARACPTTPANQRRG